MADDSEKKYKELIGYFFSETAAPFTAIKGYSHLLEFYLVALKQRDNSPIALDNPPGTNMTPEMAHQMVQRILQNIQRYEETMRQLREHMYPEDTELD